MLATLGTQHTLDLKQLKNNPNPTRTCRKHIADCTLRH